MAGRLILDAEEGSPARDLRVADRGLADGARPRAGVVSAPHPASLI